MELICIQFSFSQHFILQVYVTFGLKPEKKIFMAKKISFPVFFLFQNKQKQNRQSYIKWLLVLSL